MFLTNKTQTHVLLVLLLDLPHDYFHVKSGFNFQSGTMCPLIFTYQLIFFGYSFLLKIYL